MTVLSRHHLAAALALGAVSLVGSPVMAQQLFTNNLVMQVEVQASCSVTGDTLDFVTYTKNQEQPQEAEGTISFADCPVGSVVSLGDGGASNYLNRRMTGAGGDELEYQLYTDSSRSTIWPAAIGGDTPTVDASGTMSVYGRIGAGQDVAGGSYSNTVTITVTVN